MPSPSPEALSLGRAYRLALGFEPKRGGTGEHLAKGTGASLEFQDRRNYMPGDDIRHVDWRALARTNQVLVRQYREEILPHVELLLDASRSMALDPQKEDLSLNLAAVLASAAQGQGFRVRVIRLGERVERLEAGEFLGAGLEFDSARPLQELVREAGGLLRPGGLRILLSDFLSPHDPRELLRSLGRGVGGLALVQVLAKGDLDPPRDSALRVTDVELGEHLDLVLDGPLRARYLARLERLIDGLQSECGRLGALHVKLDASQPLGELCRSVLMRAGLLAPA